MSSRDHVSSSQFFMDGTHGQRFDKIRDMSPYQRGTLGQVGAEPGIGRALFGRPSARQASANRGITAGSHSARDTVGILDEAFRGPGTGLLGRAWGGNLSGPGAERRLRDTAWSRYWRG